MNAYTVSKLARDAGTTVHIVRDYARRGLFRHSRRTNGGYYIYDEEALERLQFVLAAKVAGVSLSDLTEMIEALDCSDSNRLCGCVERIKQELKARRNALTGYEARLSGLLRSVRNTGPMRKFG